MAVEEEDHNHLDRNGTNDVRMTEYGMDDNKPRRPTKPKIRKEVTHGQMMRNIMEGIIVITDHESTYFFNVIYYAAGVSYR